MGTKAPETGVKKPTFTPKALIHQKYASKASYRIEEVQETLENGCPGLAIGQQSRILYRCFLDLPELSVVSDTFTRKKDAEQSAAQIAVEKLGIQSNLNSSTPEEAWNELVARMSGLFTDEFLSSSHPLVVHFGVSLRRAGNLYGTIPMTVIAACDVKVNSLCKIIDPRQNQILSWSYTKYYMDEIAEKLNVNDSSQIIVSRTVGKASSDMKLYFPIPEACIDVNMERLLNKRASYFSGQSIYGNAIFANIGYTRKSSELFCEDVSLCSYYRMLLGKLPDGAYKVSREAIFAAELPTSYTSRSNWKGPSPRDLLCVFCRQQRLSEPIFSVTNVDSYEISSELSGNCKEVQHANGGIGGIDNKDSDKSILLKCEVKIFSRRQETLAEFSFADTYRKESDAIQNSALKVLNWFDNYLKQLDMPIEKISSFGSSDNIKVYPQAFAQEFAMYLSVYGVKQNYFPGKCSSLGSFPRNLSIPKFENGMILFSIDGPDSGVFPSPGSLTCISYATSLVKEEINLKEVLESNDEFEFEVGTGAVISQIEACVTQLSINQAATFVIEAPSREIILAAAGESANRLSQLPLDNCFLEFSVKVLRVTEPLEDRMEKALFSPPLSKQRVEFAVRHINESQATTLVDFGCGSGSLLDSLLEHTTSLEKIVGVDISRKSLTRAAKVLHQKLSKTSLNQMKSAELYDGSITDFDSRLCGFDIGTCLEVIEHMEEDQAWLFGDIALSSFCPTILIVSTPNYEYNPILQRSSVPNKEEDSEDKSGPCKFRNNDHKFEWTRAQFEHWANKLALRHDYSVEFSGVGGLGDVEPGFASQIAVFRRNILNLADEECASIENSCHPCELVWEWNGQPNL
uniref:Small RNA 2'-O-methyltransferase n=1 Tax=Ananas comosus var. bracteatus TaxID=296719 RepID=A0A6V7PMJ7_ANACO|nr:unnamed protein product [Ananas comosus var. bracteatus]